MDVDTTCIGHVLLVFLSCSTFYLTTQTKVQRSRAISEVLGQVGADQASEIRLPEITERLAIDFSKIPIGKDPHELQEVH